jgi:hypothetical protein
MINLSAAYTADGEVDEAARVVGEAAALAARNRSTRVIDVLGQARAGLRQWRDTPAVRELDDKLMAYNLLPSSPT